MHRLSYGTKIWAQVSFVLSQFTRLTDRQKDGRTIALTTLHTMQRGKNVSNNYAAECLPDIPRPKKD